MQVVWFKRDLRVHDHAPLAEAAEKGPCLCLYVYEPELIASPEFDSSHLKFINEALDSLDASLQRLGSRLVRRRGEMTDVLDEIHRTMGIDALWSHAETGNRITFDRDRRVKSWTQQNDIPWHERRQHGVVRGLDQRDGWSKQWNAFMSEPQALCPQQIVGGDTIDLGKQGIAADFSLLAETLDTQLGGEERALGTLSEFLEDRGEGYRKGMSSPVTAVKACSRLSPYLAWGCVSMKRVFQTLTERQVQLRADKKNGKDIGSWLGSLSAFRSRLSWHCHFMQKLEDEPEIEFQNMSRAYDGLREDEFDQARFDAWKASQTGYPLVDACMRALRDHRWINFRMRAMLVSFASYHLWLHWRPTALFLAKHFLDFEPGIHFSQVQMQSGTTGINTVRIYSPIKQVKDQDPKGEFIRKFVPELGNVPAEYLPEPHKMPMSVQQKTGCVIGKQYPPPIVEHATAYRDARARIAAVRRQEDAKAEAQQVFAKHGSRRRGTRRRSSSAE